MTDICVKIYIDVICFTWENIDSMLLLLLLL